VLRLNNATFNSDSRLSILRVIDDGAIFNTFAAFEKLPNSATFINIRVNFNMLAFAIYAKQFDLLHIFYALLVVSTMRLVITQTSEKTMPRISFENVPKQLINCMMQTEQYINSVNIIDKSFMEVLRYRVSMINKCVYCIEMHFKEAVAAGETELRIYASSTWRDVTFYSKAEQALLAWTEFVTMLNDSAPQRQQLFDDLTNYFNQDEIANLTLSIIQINAWNRLAKAFGFEAGSYQVGQY
jgi:AhpD family alkylhydroperoxidase